MLKRLKFEIDQLVSDMLDKIPLEMWESETSTFLDPAMGGGQFIRAIIETLREYGHSDENIRGRVFGIENGQLRVNFVVNKYGLIGTYISTDFLSWETDMKFDVIVGNFPYQKKRGDSDATIAIWDKFIEKSFEISNDGGYLALVHPGGWRNVDGRFTYIRDLLLSKKMEYLEIHNEKDGIATFGAETRYDWYVVKNSKRGGTTTVLFEDGVRSEVDLNKLPFIPNHSYNKIATLVAQPGEPTVEILHSYSAYFCRGKAHISKNHVEETKTSIHRYPVIYTITSSGVPTLKWSSRDDLGHYHIPKLIWSNGRISSVGSLLDVEGKYGLTQFAYAIVDSVENLPHIKRAFDSSEFRDLMYACSMGVLSINYRIIATFRKDFWKEFA